MDYDLKRKALIVIEHIAVHGDEDDTEMGLVYRACHAANDECGNRHEDWKKWVEEFYDSLVARGEYHPGDAAEKREKWHEMLMRLENLRPPPAAAESE